MCSLIKGKVILEMSKKFEHGLYATHLPYSLTHSISLYLSVSFYLSSFLRKPRVKRARGGKGEKNALVRAGTRGKEESERASTDCKGSHAVLFLNNINFFFELPTLHWLLFFWILINISLRKVKISMHISKFMHIIILGSMIFCALRSLKKINRSK